MQVAVIGAGRWGRNLARNLHALGALHGIAEPESDAVAALESLAPFVRYRTHDELLDSDVTAVAIATPSAMHFKIAKAALDAGKDVFVEKPMTLLRAHAEDLVGAAERAERVLMVGHLLLFQPAIVWIKDLIRSGRLGRIRRLHHQRLQFGRPRVAENALWSLGVHDVAVALHLVGASPTAVHAVGQPGPTGPDEDVHLTMELGDVQVRVHASWAWPERVRRLTVVGDAGILVYDELSQEVTLHEKWIDGGAAKAVDRGADVVFRGHGEPVRLEMEHFLACLRDRKTPRSDGRDGVAVVDVLERANAHLAAAR